MNKEIKAALAGGACTIIAAIIGIISFDITPDNMANSKELEDRYNKLNTENADLKQQFKDLEQKYSDLSLLYESLAEETVSPGGGSSPQQEAPSDSSGTETNQNKARWIQDNVGWRFQMPDGSFQKDGWLEIDGQQYCFDSAGYIRIGWILSDDGIYSYCDPYSGAMLTSQWTPDGYWVDENGAWVQSEDKKQQESMAFDNTEKKTSIFTMDTFQRKGFWFNRSNDALTDDNFIDTYGNEYLAAYSANHSSKTKDSNTAPVYLLDKKYRLCRGQFAWSKEAKNLKGSIWIEFYSGDSLLYKTSVITATDRAVSFEFSVEGVETLTIVRNASTSRSIHVVYPYLDLIE